MPTTQQVLDHLAKHPEGLTFTQIQRFIVESNGFDYDKKEIVNEWEVRRDGAKPKSSRVYRGYWCCALLATGRLYGNYREGILSKHCNKVGKLYILKDPK